MFANNRKQKKFRFSYLTEKYKTKLKERPIPNFKDTQKAFIKFLRPFLDNKSDSEFHEELITEFVKQEGNKLQKKLIDFSKGMTSWYHNLVLEDFYLKNRKPIPFYSNFFVVYEINFTDQIDACAKLIIGCIFLKGLIKNNRIGEITVKDYSQYFYLFHSTRSPTNNAAASVVNNNSENSINEKNENKAKPNDNKNPTWVSNSDSNSNNSARKSSENIDLSSQEEEPEIKHISKPRDWLNVYDYNDNKFVIVVYKNIFWLVETSLDYDNLSDQILYITSLDISESQENFIGTLTGANRNSWGKYRHKFTSMHPKNKEFIYFIERSMFIFCLCDSIYDRIQNTKELFNILWYNDLQNRFFDKIMQIIVFKDATICLNMDKSVIDISVALEFLKFLKFLNDEDHIPKTAKKNIQNNFAKNKTNKQSIPSNAKYPNKALNLSTISTLEDFSMNSNKDNNLSFSLSLSQQNNKPSLSSVINSFNEGEVSGDYNDYFETSSYKPVKLNYILDEDIKSEIHKTLDYFNSNITDKFYADVFIFKDYGKGLFDRKGIDMNAFLQLAILSAHYRLNGKVVASRQFICGRNFKFGFVDFVRTTTRESVNFIVSLNELRVPRELKIKLGQDFFKTNRNNVTDVINGRSLDVHFTGLKWIAESKNFNNNNNKKSKKFKDSANRGKKANEADNEAETELEFLTKILNDETFKKSCDWIIETFPIVNENVKICAQGYSNELEGISITFIARKDHIQFNIVSANDLNKFVNTLEEILYEMKDLFLEKGRDYKPKF